MFKRLFKKKETEAVSQSNNIELKAHATGKVSDIKEVPDPIFSEKMMGEGIAIDPDVGAVVSPVDGVIMHIFPTKHAVGIKASNGVEVLIHIGVETVTMNGEGFEAHVENGQRVKTGDILVTFDLALVKEKAESAMIPMIITNSKEMEKIEQVLIGDHVTAGEQTILKVTSK